MSYSKFLLSFLLFFFFISFDSSSSFFQNASKCSVQQAIALLQFKENITSISDASYRGVCEPQVGSRYYSKMMKWNKNVDCCKWNGITCDHFTGEVIGIDLSCGMLRGTIHLNTTLFHLPHLQTLNLAYNSLYYSQLSRGISRFSNSLTHLNLSECGFIGDIPSEVLLLSKLVSLDLSNNWDLRIQPHVFNNLLGNSSHLRELLLARVNISWLLPTYLNISSSLRSLDLSSTNLQGKLPNNIFNLQYLETLDLSQNYLVTGPLPKVSINQSSLRSLGLSSNNLQGKIPHNIFNLQYLENLDLTLNYLVTGPFPKVSINQSSLRFLMLVDTRLQGKLPDDIFNLQSLEYLDLSGNNITGPLPKFNTALKWLDVSHTNSLGELPDSIGHLISLEHLGLYDCGLVGSFPKSLVNLRHLIDLDLGHNMLVGTVPAFLFTLPLLENIVLEKNMFSGELPSELYNCRSLKTLYLSNNQFDGEIKQGSTLPSFNQLVNLISLRLSWNYFTGVWELETLLSNLPTLEELDLSYTGLSVVTNNATDYYVNPDFQTLNLASCKLTEFPNSLRAMKNLYYLDLSNNDIQGDIPYWAGEIGDDRLDHLNLSHNSITGLPQLLWVGLADLYLQSNLIEGPIPASFCNMRNLRYLDLSDNRFGGVIPRCVEHFTTPLSMVDMSNNRFHGTIPNMGSDTLCWLILKQNQLEGEIPTSLAKFQALEILDLGNNHLNGTFPGWLGDLPMLQVLVLRFNNFHGPIDTSWPFKLSFPLLQVLDLSHNRFVGHLGRFFFQNFKAMNGVVKYGPEPQYLNKSGLYYSFIIVVKGQLSPFVKVLVDYKIVDLSGNNFEGEIPNVIGTLNLLKSLNLSHNNLNGRIPKALGNLSEIESLDLSWNQLTGEIPQSIANLTSLEVLNLSQNRLEGRIPSGSQFLTFDESSFGGNSGLCGSPLPKQCGHSSFPQPEGEGEGGGGDDKEEDSGFTWKLVMLGFGCGILIGLVIGYLMLSSGRPKWFNDISDAAEHMIRSKQNKRRIVYIGK